MTLTNVVSAVKNLLVFTLTGLVSLYESSLSVYSLSAAIAAAKYPEWGIYHCSQNHSEAAHNNGTACFKDQLGHTHEDQSLAKSRPLQQNSTCYLNRIKEKT
jgi:hypothetical protein